MRKIACVALVALSIATSVFGITRTWTGASSNRTSDPGNWSPAGIPEPGDDWIFPEKDLAIPTIENDLPAAFVVRYLSFPFNSGWRYEFTGNAITLVAGGIGYAKWHPDIIIADDQKLTPQSFLGTIDLVGHTLFVKCWQTGFISQLRGTGTLKVDCSEGATVNGTSNFSGTILGERLRLSNASHPNAVLSAELISGTGLAAQMEGRLFPGGPDGGGTLTADVVFLKGVYSPLSPSVVRQIIAKNRLTISPDATLVLTPAEAFFPHTGDVFILVRNDSSSKIEGTFATLPEGKTIQIGAEQLRITYEGGDGNDITLTVVTQKRWTGRAGDHLWSNPANWDPEGTPASGEDVSFGGDPRDVIVDVAEAAVGMMRIVYPDTIGRYVFKGNPLSIRGGLSVQGYIDFANELRPEGDVSFTLTGVRILNLKMSGNTLTVASYMGWEPKISAGGDGTIISDCYVGFLDGTFNGTITGCARLRGSLPNATAVGKVQGSGYIGTIDGEFIAPGVPTLPLDFASYATLQAGKVFIRGSYNPEIACAGDGDLLIAENVTIGPDATLGAGVHWREMKNNCGVGRETLVLRNDGTSPVVGTFRDVPEGGIYQNGWRGPYIVTYRGGDGNDIVLRHAAGTATTLQVDPVVVRPPHPAKLQAIVAVQVWENTLAPYGVVAFFDGQQLLGTAAVSNGLAMLETTLRVTGMHHLRAEYMRSDFYVGSTSPVVDVEVASGPPTASIAGSVIDEGNSGSTTATLTITLSNPSPDRVEVHWRTLDETATAGSDYILAAGTCSFEPGETSKTIELTILGDTTPEDTETFQVVLYDPVNADLGENVAQVRILTDDALYRTLNDVAHPAGLLTLRVPNGGTPPYPLVVAIEAASWSFVTRHATGAEFLARRGYAVATIEFTPSTIAHWPRQLDDVRSAIAWLREHAKEFDIDRDAIGVLGMRAGGQLAAHLGLRGDVQAIVDWNGPVDFHQLDGCGSLYADVATLIGCDPASCVETVKTACPTACAAKTDVPFLILQAANDCAVPFAQGTTFAGTMRGLGADVTFFAIDDDRAAQDFALRFFDAHLRGVAVKRRATR